MEAKDCLHLSWAGRGGVMVCRRCGAQRLPFDWENAWEMNEARERTPAQLSGTDRLRIRHDGQDGDV